MNKNSKQRQEAARPSRHGFTKPVFKARRKPFPVIKGQKSFTANGLEEVSNPNTLWPH